MAETFEDSLGEVIVTTTHVERKRSDSDAWDEVEEQFDASQLVDKLHISKIEELDFQPESDPSLIRLETEDGWRNLPLKNMDNAIECFKAIRYQWHVHQQNH